MWRLPDRYSEAWWLSEDRRWDLRSHSFSMVHDILDQLSLISQLQVVTEGAQVIVTVEVTSEEERTLKEARLHANITEDLSAVRMLAFLFERMNVGTLDQGHLGSHGAYGTALLLNLRFQKGHSLG